MEFLIIFLGDYSIEHGPWSALPETTVLWLLEIHIFFQDLLHLTELKEYLFETALGQIKVLYVSLLYEFLKKQESLRIRKILVGDLQD